MAARGRVWCLLAVLLATGVVSALHDPFFDRVSGNWNQVGLEGEPDQRPIWRIPGTIETLSFVPILSAASGLPPVNHRPGLPPFARPPFVPPRV
jgi:hypothetical protein